MRWMTLLGAVAALSAGCDPGFEDRALVKDLRVLAVRAEPPEVLYPAVSPFAVPADVARRFDLTVLIADPAGPGEATGRPLSCALRACVPSRNRRCEDPETTWALTEGPCADGETTFAVTIPSEAIAASQAEDEFWLACAAASEANPDANCYSGLAVFVEVKVSGGEYDLYALKSVVFSPELPAGRTANRNPVIDGIRVGEGADARVLSPDAATGIVELPFTPGETLRIEATRTADSKENYVLPTFSGGKRELEEYLDVAFYADAGDFSHATRSDRPDNPFAADPDDPEPVEMWSDWDPPETGPSRLWLVMTDGRGGVSWIRATAAPR